MKKPSRITDWADAIKAREGFFAPGENKNYPNGTRAWKNHNPGNIKDGPYVRQWLGAYGADDKGFARFYSYQDGYDGLCQYLRDAAGWYLIPYKSYAKQHGLTAATFTLRHFYDVYAPEADNNDSNAYAEFVAARLGVPVTTPIKDLL